MTELLQAVAGRLDNIGDVGKLHTILEIAARYKACNATYQQTLLTVAEVVGSAGDVSAGDLPLADNAHGLRGEQQQQHDERGVFQPPRDGLEQFQTSKLVGI